MINFDPSINIGHIMEMGMIAIGGLGVIYTIRSDVKTLKSDVAVVQNEIKKIADVMVALGRQDERLNSVDKRLDYLMVAKAQVPESQRSLL